MTRVLTCIVLACSLSHCIKTRSSDDPIKNSNVASLIVAKISNAEDIAALRVVIREDRQNAAVLVTKDFLLSPADGDKSDMSIKVKPGPVVIKLDYKGKDGTVILSTEYCSEEDRKSSKVTLVPGPNRVRPFVCDMAKIPTQILEPDRPGQEPPTTQQEPWTDFSQGYATRYWDCCKPHCGWPTNIPRGNPVATCDFNNSSLGDRYLESTGCDGGNAFTCYNMAPWSVSSSLSYGYAAVPGGGDVCGKCYELRFTGTGHHGQNEGATRLRDKRMIVQATNIGWDVGGGQFDILTPGGGVGAFNACSRQWGINAADLGAQYGGILTTCRQNLGWNAAHDENKRCVRDACQKLFSAPERSDLLKGCQWFVDWYEVADNPNLEYKEVTCPPELKQISGM